MAWLGFREMRSLIREGHDDDCVVDRLQGHNKGKKPRGVSCGTMMNAA